MSNTTSLGKQAETGILVANTQVRSPSFSQQQQTVGSPATPVSTQSQAYTAGINKYVFYYPLSVAAFDVEFSITGLPANFASNYSTVCQGLCVPSDSFLTPPDIITSSYLEGSGTQFTCRQHQNGAPFAFGGTAYIKVVILFTLDF